MGAVRRFNSHGDGRFQPGDLGARGRGVVLEDGLRLFRPDLILLGDNVYLGHEAMLKAYPTGGIRIADDCWIGPRCMFSGAALITIEEGVGVGPGVQILTSTHDDPGAGRPILEGALRRAPVHIGAGSDIGAGSIILPGVRIGRGVQIGAGSVVTADVPDRSVAAGVPARVIGTREA